MNVVKTKCFIFFYLKDVSDNLDFFHKLGFQFESLLSCEVGLIPPQSPFLEGLGKPGFSHCWGHPCHSLMCWQCVQCLAWRRSKPARFQVMATIPGLHNFQYFEGIRNSHFSPKCSLMNNCSKQLVPGFSVDTHAESKKKKYFLNMCVSGRS